jgi:hypothetical protein
VNQMNPVFVAGKLSRKRLFLGKKISWLVDFITAADLSSLSRSLLIVACFGFVSAVNVVECPGQTSGSTAKATPVTASSSRPNGIQIKQNILAQKKAAIDSELKEVQRCLANASQPVALRDPEGNLNRVPQTDLLNCGRRLAELQRQLESLARQAAMLSQDSEALRMAALRKYQAEKVKQRLSGMSDQ